MPPKFRPLTVKQREYRDQQEREEQRQRDLVIAYYEAVIKQQIINYRYDCKDLFDDFLRDNPGYRGEVTLGALMQYVHGLKFDDLRYITRTLQKKLLTNEFNKFDNYQNEQDAKELIKEYSTVKGWPLDSTIFDSKRPKSPVKKDEPIEETKEHIINQTHEQLQNPQIMQKQQQQSPPTKDKLAEYYQVLLRTNLYKKTPGKDGYPNLIHYRDLYMEAHPDHPGKNIRVGTISNWFKSMQFDELRNLLSDSAIFHDDNLTPEQLDREIATMQGKVDFEYSQIGAPRTGQSEKNESVQSEKSQTKSQTKGMQQYIAPDSDEKPFEEIPPEETKQPLQRRLSYQKQPVDFFNMTKTEQNEAIFQIDIDTNTNLFAATQALKSQQNVPKHVIDEDLQDSIDIIVANKQRNPKAMTTLKMLITRAMQRDTNAKMPAGMQQNIRADQGVVGSMEESKDLMGTSGVENLKPVAGKQSMPIVADKLLDVQIPEKLLTHLLSIINNPKTDPESKKRAKGMINKYAEVSHSFNIMKQLQPAMKAAEQAKLNIENVPMIPQQNDHNSGTVIAMSTLDSGTETLPPQMSDRQPVSLLDATETQAKKQFAEQLIQQHEMTDPQVQIFNQVVSDIPSIQQNIAFISQQKPRPRSKSKSGISRLVEQFAMQADQEMYNNQPAHEHGPMQNPHNVIIGALPPAQQQQNPAQQRPNQRQPPKSNPNEQAYLHTTKMASQTNIGKSIEHQYATAAGLHGAHKKTHPIHQKLILPRGVKQAARQGNTTAQAAITLYGFFNYMAEAAEYISEIAGDMTNTDLSSYKNQTAIFTTSIVKKEPGKFQIAPNSMYKIRECC